ALGRLLLEHGSAAEAFIAAHTNGFAAYRDFLLAQDLAELSAVAGIDAATLDRVARQFAGAKGLLSFYCMGLNKGPGGVWKNTSLTNLPLLTGQIGKPGAGPFSLTGQPNAMGGREAGLLSHQLPGYRFVDNAGDRRELESFWGRPEGCIKPAP